MSGPRFVPLRRRGTQAQRMARTIKSLGRVALFIHAFGGETSLRERGRRLARAGRRRVARAPHIPTVP